MRRTILAGLLLCLSASAGAALLGRAPLTPGGTDYQAYYDTSVNVTWLADANLATSNTFGVAGIAPAGYMSLAKANEWVTAMNAANHLGASNWRLPNTIDTGTSGCNFAYSGTDCGYNVDTSTSEMASLFYDTLGGVSDCDTAGSCPVPGSGLDDVAPFTNLRPDYYWSGTPYAPDDSQAWFFNFSYGYQAQIGNIYPLYVWAVSPGDLLPAPIPTAAWLISPAFGLLAPWVKRRAQA